MKIRDHIADDLRRRPADLDRLGEALVQGRRTVAKMRALVEDEPSELNRSDLGRQASRLADHLLLADECDEALALKEEAVGIWRRLGRDKARFLAELDAAEIRFELGRRDEALADLDSLVAQSAKPAFQVYRDFALALRGRCRARTDDTAGGRADLQEALELRRERGNQRQIDHTKRLLELVASQPPDRA
ncbi:MAG: hypothetical protein ACLFVJ_21430 [Persicimonas sp.]